MYVRLTSSQLAAWAAQGASPCSASSQRRRPPVVAVAHGVHPAEEGADRVPHGFMDDESVAPRIDERQAEQRQQRFMGVFPRHHRREQRLRRRSDDGGRLEGPAGGGGGGGLGGETGEGPPPPRGRGGPPPPPPRPPPP